MKIYNCKGNNEVLKNIVVVKSLLKSLSQYQKDDQPPCKVQMHLLFEHKNHTPSKFFIKHIFEYNWTKFKSRIIIC